MSQSKFFLALCLVLFMACLTTGYWIAEHRIGAVAALLMSPAWLLARKYPNSWLPFVCLLVSVAFSVIGILTGSPPLVMILASAAALAVWDLLLLDAAMGMRTPEGHTRQYMTHHLQSLMLALMVGLITIFLGHPITIGVPFIVLILFVIFILFALDRIWGYLKKTGRR
jgi:hypothetical protein